MLPRLILFILLVFLLWIFTCYLPDPALLHRQPGISASCTTCKKNRLSLLIISLYRLFAATHLSAMCLLCAHNKEFFFFVWIHFIPAQCVLLDSMTPDIFSNSITQLLHVPNFQMTNYYTIVHNINSV